MRVRVDEAGGDDLAGGVDLAATGSSNVADARDAAMGGWKSLAAFIKSLTPIDRAMLDSESYELKKAAKAADAAKLAQPTEATA